MVALLLLMVGLTTLALAAGTRDWLADRADRRDMTGLLRGPSVEQGLAGWRRRADRALQRTRAGAWTQVALEESGLRQVRAGDAVGVTVVTILVLSVAVGLLLTPLLSPLVVVGAVPAVVLLVRRQQDRRRERFIAQMPQLARVLSNATQAGLSLRTAVEIASEELADPAGAEMGRVASSLAVGESITGALEALERRLPSREVAVLTSVLVVSSRAGGSLISSLRTIADTLEERKQTRREVRTMLSEARATAVLIPIVGVTSLLLLDSLGEDTLDTMLRQPLGQVLVLVALGAYVLGGVLFARVTRVDA